MPIHVKQDLLLNALEKWLVKPNVKASEELIEKIQNGFLESKHTTPRMKKIVKGSLIDV